MRIYGDTVSDNDDSPESRKRISDTFDRAFKLKCKCGGYMNDWHSHTSDCVVINNNKEDSKCQKKKRLDVLNADSHIKVK